VARKLIPSPSKPAIMDPLTPVEKRDTTTMHMTNTKILPILTIIWLVLVRLHYTVTSNAVRDAMIGQKCLVRYVYELELTRNSQ